jgi:hypothetical protein
MFAKKLLKYIRVGSCFEEFIARNTRLGCSVNRNRSVWFLGFLQISVTYESRTDRLLHSARTEAIRFWLVWFGFG